jgi:spore coat polysaccharide biosynthesis predicted glycosyltransferase SpsG
MRLVFRADASTQIGSGHVMRVTTIAQEAISRGIECHFVGRVSELTWVEEYIDSLGFRSITENEGSWIPDYNRDVLIMDSYTIGLSSQYNNPTNWRLSICVTDGFTPVYSTDIEISQSLRIEEVDKARITFSGANYALVRKGIRKSNKVFEIGSPISVLLLGGGSDPFGFVRAILKVIQTIDINLEVNVFSNENLEEFDFPEIRQYEIGPKLDLVATDMDLVITTASTSSIEFIAREIPTLIVCAIDNQQVTYRELSELKYALPIGHRDPEGVWLFDHPLISSAFENPNIRENLKNRIHGLIDLRGPGRVVDEIQYFLTEGELRR